MFDNVSFLFFLEAVMLGFGLAMDAFSISLANGLNEPCMPKKKIFGVAGMFAIFQGAMPMLGWLFVSTVIRLLTAANFTFDFFGKDLLEFIETLVVPVCSLLLLGFIGAKMLIEGIKENREQCNSEDGTCDPCRPHAALGFGALIVQAIATSIDALSVGFTVSNYSWVEALITALIIAVLTFPICFGGILIGRAVGTKLSGKAGIIGGAVLIFIGLEIFITGVFNLG